MPKPFNLLEIFWDYDIIVTIDMPSLGYYPALGLYSAGQSRHFQTTDMWLSTDFQHQKRHDAKSQEDRYFCLICPGYVAFPSVHKLKLHRQGPVHQSDKDMACPHCPKVFKKSPGLLQAHIIKHHGGPEMGGPDFITCESCGKVFKDRRQKTSHM